MGREIRRVPFDFDWPLNKTWPGFLINISGPKCTVCNGQGYSPEAQDLRQSFHQSWRTSLTQDEVDALVDGDRLWDFTRDWVPGEGWKKKDPPYRPTAEEVNEWAKTTAIAHDSLNASIAVRVRCERWGLPELCSYCEGNGYWELPEDVRAALAPWTGEDGIDVEIPVPEGEGWQLWETVSEGSPISPVFEDAEGLIAWLASPAYEWGISVPLTYEEAAAWVHGPGWAPSMVIGTRGLEDGVTAIARESLGE